MYSPKIREEFIPQLYKLKEIHGIRNMTDLVNQIIERYIHDCQDDLRAYDESMHDQYDIAPMLYEVEESKPFDFLKFTEENMDLIHNEITKN